MIPYGRHSVGKDDVKAVVRVLLSDWLTQGLQVEKFEQLLAEYCGVKYAVVVSSGTAALHTAFVAAGIGEGDEFITTPMTFVATANAGLYADAKPVFVDIDEKTGNIDAEKIEEKITDKTKAIVPVDYTGRPADLEKIKQIADKHNLVVVEDACQALGAVYHGKKIGAISDLTVFSFHPVKSITTGEGGAILTNNEEDYKKMKRFIKHGISRENLDKNLGAWYFDMVDLGQNYRLTDFACALGISQLKKLDQFVQKRREIVKKYNNAFKAIAEVIIPLPDDEIFNSAWHLYVIRLRGVLADKRSEIFDKLRAQNIGAQVHHIPVYMHSYYKKLGYAGDSFPNTQNWYNSIISLPLYAGLTRDDQEYIIGKIKSILDAYI